MLLTIMPQISYLSKGNCENSPRLFCREERNLEIFGDLILEMEGGFEIVISLRDMFYYNEKTSRYDSYIEISDMSEGITLGKSVFAKYFVEFNNEENYKIVLSHRPEVFKEYVNANIDNSSFITWQAYSLPLVLPCKRGSSMPISVISAPFFSRIAFSLCKTVMPISFKDFSKSG